MPWRGSAPANHLPKICLRRDGLPAQVRAALRPPTRRRQRAATSKGPRDGWPPAAAAASAAAAPPTLAPITGNLCAPPLLRRSPTKAASAKRPLPTVIPALLGLVAAAMLLLILCGGSSSSFNMLSLSEVAGLSAGLHATEQAAPSWSGTALAALRNCSDFRCLRAAHTLPRGPGQPFNFPHFFIIGASSFVGAGVG